MNQNRLMSNSFILSTFPAVTIFVIIYLFIYRIQGIYMIDDAFIFYRYAENWANGYGPVFNISEYVEGYSSFLWTAILALGAFLSFEPVTFAPILNLFIGIACLFLMSYICSFINFSKPRLMGIALPLVYVFSYGIYLYGISGMDTLLFSSVLLLSILVVYRAWNTKNYSLIIPFLFLLNLARAEGPLYAVVLLAVLTYFNFKEYNKIPKQLFLAIYVFIILTILLLAARYIVYNEILPATVQAKGYATYALKKVIFEKDIEGAKEFYWVIRSGLKYASPLLFVGAIPFIFLFLNKDKKDLLIWLIASFIAVSVFVTVWAGGDWMPFYRFFISFLPILIVFIGWAVDLLMRKNWEDLKKRIILFSVLLLTGILWVGFFVRPEEFIKKHDTKKVESLKQLGILLHDLQVPTTLLTDMAGILPYYAGINVYVRDLFGLTDIHNAKYGDTFIMLREGGVVGRTDYIYSFTAPFDIFVYTSKTTTARFVAFCQKDPSICQKYRFFKKEERLDDIVMIYVIANINHPVSKALEEKFGAVPLVIDENLKELLKQYKHKFIY